MILQTGTSIGTSLSCVRGIFFHRQQNGLCLFSCTARVSRRSQSFRGVAIRASTRSEDVSEPVQGSVVQIDLELPRRRLMVQFTCNKCSTTSQRLVNPHAYKRGTVFLQCAGCEAYHQLVDNLGLIVEYDFRKEQQGESSDGSVCGEDEMM